VRGADRPAALARLRQALDEVEIAGLTTNVAFLRRVAASRAFAAAELDTGLIERENALLFPAAGAVPADVWLLAALAELLREERLAEKKAAQAADPHSPWRALDGWRLNGRAARKLTLRHGDVMQQIGVEVIRGGHQLTLGNQRVYARGTLGADSELHAQLGERRVRAAVVAAGERRQVFFGGRSWPLSLVDTLHVGGEGEEVEGGLRAPMPGKVIALVAQPGATVQKGAPLLVMEAMKMEHTISAPRKGVVKGFRYAPGDQVSDGAELVDFEGAE